MGTGFGELSDGRCGGFLRAPEVAQWRNATGQNEVTRNGAGCSGQGGGNVGVGEIVADEEKRFVAIAGQGIGEAIPKVEFRSVT